LSTLDLDTRLGWPPELQTLLKQYPREVWPGHANLDVTAQFWLERHEGFRQLGRTLEDATTEFREAKVPAAAFRRFFAPRLQFFLQGLEGHHQVEDFSYFPIFRAAEARLARGFDILESDHDAIHAEIMRTVDSANALLRTIEGGDDARRAATDSYADASERLLKFLLRHLNDEEDLIMPVILDQGERKLFGMPRPGWEDWDQQ
jgi:hemerythrin-like domain-containing protein